MGDTATLLDWFALHSSQQQVAILSARVNKLLLHHQPDCIDDKGTHLTSAIADAHCDSLKDCIAKATCRYNAPQEHPTKHPACKLNKLKLFTQSGRLCQR
jgi:hypothetical protein